MVVLKGAVQARIAPNCAGQYSFSREFEEYHPNCIADVDEWQTETQLKAMRLATIRLYAEGLDGADRALTCVRI